MIFLRTNKYKTSFGFTLIEVLVVIVITSLIFVATVPRLHGFRLKNDLKSTVSAMKEQIRQIHTWSMAVKAGTTLAPEETDFTDRQVAYAVHFDLDNSIYTAWEVWQDSEGTEATFDTAETQTPAARRIEYSLPDGFEILSIEPDNADIFFLIPSGEVTGLLQQGAENASTVGASTTVNTINGAFSALTVGSLFIADDQSTYVVGKTSDNEIEIDKMVDWSKGYPFQYSNAFDSNGNITITLEYRSYQQTITIAKNGNIY